MSQPTLNSRWLQGVWTENPAIVQLLGLCPLLAVSTSATYGLALGLTTLVVLSLSNLLVSLMRPVTPHHARIPVYVMIIASLVTAAAMLIAAFAPELHKALGLFIPLIVTNCTLLARAESFASRTSPISALTDGITQGAGFLLALLALGAIREIIGAGTLFNGLDQLLGPSAIDWHVSIGENPRGLGLALLPPGAFFLLAVLVASHRSLSSRQQPQGRKTSQNKPSG